MSISLKAYCDLSQVEAYWQNGTLTSDKLLACLPVLRELLPAAPWPAKEAWSALLSEIWADLANNASHWDVPFEFGQIAARMGFWRQASEFYGDSIAHYGEHGATLHNRGMCHWQLGQLNSAASALQRAAQFAPANETIHESLRLVQAFREECRDSYGPHPIQEDGGELQLQLMAPHHAEGLFYHQRDGKIAGPVELPQLDSVSRTERWIALERQEPGKVPFTLIHHRYGAIGAAALTRHGNRALFYYWLAESLQNQRLGGRLLALVVEAARRLGIKTLYATVFPDNKRSQRVLASRQFRTMPSWLTTGNRLRDVYYLPVAMAEGDCPMDGFVRLCKARCLPFKHFETTTGETAAAGGETGTC